MMRKITLAALSAIALTVAATPAYALTEISPCDPALTNPDADDCAGYYSGNLINGSAEDIANQQAAIASLSGSFVWDGNWGAVDPEFKITSLSGPSGNRLNFGTTMYGLTVIGAHFGNVAGPAGNVSVFWQFDFGQAGADYITLDNVQGFSNAVLYTAPGIPEPATWAMMLVGFGAVGSMFRRRRAKLAVSYA